MSDVLPPQETISEMRGSSESIESISLALDARRVRLVGLWILLAALFPVSLGISGGLYLTRLIPEVEQSDQLGLMAPIILGFALLLISAIARNRLELGAGSLLSLFLTGSLFWSSDIASGDLYGGLLSFIGRQPVPVMVGLSLVSAGATLKLQEPKEPIGSFLLKLGSTILLILYVLPQRGRPFAVDLVETMYTVTAHGDSRQLLGYGVFWLLDLMPLFIAIRALLAAHDKQAKDSLLGPIARYGLSGVVVLMCYRFMVTGFGLDAVLYQLRSALILGVTIEIGSFGVELIARYIVTDPLPLSPAWSRKARDIQLRKLLRAYLEDDQHKNDKSLLEMPAYLEANPLLRWTMKRRLNEIAEMERFKPLVPLSPDYTESLHYLKRLEGYSHPGPPMTKLGHIKRFDEKGIFSSRLLSSHWQLATALSLLCAGTLSVAMWQSQSEGPDIHWVLNESSENQEQLFSKHFPDYVDALSRYSYIRAKGSDSRKHKARVAQEVQSLLGAAYAINRNFGEDVRSFVNISEDPDFSGRVWLRAIRRINEGIRSLGMPYYIQANFVEMSPKSRIRRIFYVLTYRVEKLRRFHVAGEEHAAIHLRKLGGLNLGGRWLGLVRGDMPFALVMIDEIEEYVAQVLHSVVHEGSCGTAERNYHPLADRADTACASFISDIIEERGFDAEKDFDALTELFIDIQIRSTERHELQHLVDGQGPDIPLDLFELAPRSSDDQLSIVTKELSAQLAEFNTKDSLAIALALAQAQSFLLADNDDQDSYRLGAGLIIEHLTNQNVIETFGKVELQPLVDAWTLLRQNHRDLRNWAQGRAQSAHNSLDGSECADLRLIEEHHSTHFDEHIAGSPKKQP